MYKIGDKVKIREDLEVNKSYNELFFVKDMEKYKGKIATITRVSPVTHSYEIDIDDNDWCWTDDMFKTCINNNIVMTVEDLLNKTDVEKGGLIITVYYPNANFDTAIGIGFNKINRNSELYKRFIMAYGDMIVDEVSFDIRNENNVVMLIKVDYADNN